MSDPSVRIVTDSTCNLPRALLDESGTRVVPVQVIIHKETYREGIDITLPDFYSRAGAPGRPWRPGNDRHCRLQNMKAARRRHL